ncbi:MAG: hypothetical protein GWP05_06610 [Anaerolineaceae bacterium]|nr:hypothetical protein [Anaerolineaceae bacterium]
MKWLLVSGVFLAVLAGHFLYVTGSLWPSNKDGTWASYEFERPEESRLSRYIGPGQYWLGFSYGLAGAFTAICLVRMIRMRRESLAASAGGLALGGLLWASLCFLAGCCGSPMLPLYMGLLGPKFLGLTRPLTFALTLLSIVIGYAWMLKRSRKVVANNVNTSLHENAGADPGQV